IDHLQENISPQLPFGGLRKVGQLPLASGPKLIGGSPQQAGEYQETAGKDGKQRVSNLQPKTEVRRPELGSVLLAFLCMFPAVLLIRLGGVLRTSLGVFLAFESSVGLLL